MATTSRVEFVTVDQAEAECTSAHRSSLCSSSWQSWQGGKVHQLTFSWWSGAVKLRVHLIKRLHLLLFVSWSFKIRRQKLQRFSEIINWSCHHIDNWHNRESLLVMSESLIDFERLLGGFHSKESYSKGGKNHNANTARLTVPLCYSFQNQGFICWDACCGLLDPDWRRDPQLPSHRQKGA